MREHPLPVLGARRVAAALVVVPLAVLVARRRAFLPLAALAALPFRVPVEAGGSTANLLVPLYLVIAAGALAWAVPRIRDGEAFDPPRANGAMEWLLAGSVVLYALQAAYSTSLDKALEQTVFFYVPFALLFAVLRDDRVVAEAAARPASSCCSASRSCSSRSASSSTRRARCCSTRR